MLLFCYHPINSVFFWGGTSHIPTNRLRPQPGWPGAPQRSARRANLAGLYWRRRQKSHGMARFEWMDIMNLSQNWDLGFEPYMIIWIIWKSLLFVARKMWWIPFLYRDCPLPCHMTRWPDGRIEYDQILAHPILTHSPVQKLLVDLQIFRVLQLRTWQLFKLCVFLFLMVLQIVKLANFVAFISM